MDIKNTIISAEVVIGSLLVLLENENVDISSINFKVGSQEEGYESENMSFESLVNLTLKGLDEAKAQAVPEGFVLVKKVHPDAIVHNQGLGLFKECQVIYGWDGKSKDFKDALNKGFYHGVKLGAKAVLETAMIEAQEQGHD
ncbi:hypothetical protein [Acinetobacter indicus]|uniref:hypothetical protein n=1 Tax=Acinetobacter indicus TaxID=756892 RepID=UPI001E4E3DE5|nr:hypothetical protein [Acinetobacter indicus]